MPKENEMAKEIPVSFKASEQVESAMSKLGFDTDKSKSEILRACVCIGLPLLSANPSLIYRLDFSEFNVNHQKG